MEDKKVYVVVNLVDTGEDIIVTLSAYKDKEKAEKEAMNEGGRVVELEVKE